MRRAASGVELSQLDQLAEDLQRAQDDALEELENLVDSLNYHVRFRAVINIFEASIVADSLLRVQNIGSHGALLRRIQKAWEGIEKRYETIDRNEIVVLLDLYEACRFAIPGFADMIEAVRRLRPRLAGEAFTVSDVT